MTGTAAPAELEDLPGVVTTSFEPCHDHRGDTNAPCADCGWLLHDHDHDRVRMELAAVIEVRPARPVRLRRAS